MDRFETCPKCGGFGVLEEPRPQRDDPYFCVLEKCEECNGSGWVADGYDGQDDLAKSIALGFETIRARMAAGGPGWQRKND